MLLCALFVLAVFRRRVGRHLERLAEATAAIDLQRLDRPLALDRPLRHHDDELDTLVGAFNRMRERLADGLAQREAAESALRAYRDHLEERVAERTAELRERSEELAEQNRELDAYAHTVAHDLKHPLTTLLGASRLLDEAGSRLPESQQRAMLLAIRRSATTMQAIIDALLLLASARRSEPLSLQALDLAAIAAAATARLDGFAGEHAAQVVLQATWPAARGHPQWVEEVFSNYLSNAIKYGGEAPEVELGAASMTAASVHCWVRDRGPGIAEAQRSELFNQFVRFDTRRAEGHGLGLSIVKRIVERQGGEVGYRPRPGGGSEFWFTLPAA